MVLIAAGVLMQRRRGKILHDCATEADINDLHAFTDPENGKPVTDAQLKRLQLQDVKLCVNGTGAVIAFPEKGGSNVASAGQNQRVAACDFSDVQGNYRLKTGSSYIPDVIVCHFVSPCDCYFHGSLISKSTVSLIIYVVG